MPTRAPREGFDPASSLVVCGDVRPAAGTRTAEAVCIVDGTVTAIGSIAEVTAAAPQGIRTVHHDGVIAPAFVDSHVHVMWLGRAAGRLRLDDCTSIPQVLDRIRAAASGLPRSSWLLGSAGFDETSLEERRLPTLAELDEAAGGRPMLLDRRGHDGLASSAALHCAGIRDDSPDPVGGHFGRDADGHLTGELVEHGAVAVVSAVVPAPTESQRRGWIRAGLDELVRVGVTCAADPALGIDELAAYRDLYASEDPPVRIVVFPHAPDGSDPEHFRKQVESVGIPEDPDARLSLGPVKLFVDGGGMLGTALRHDPWPGTDSCGVQSTSTDTLERYIAWAAQRRSGLALHTVGPAAVELVLDLLRRPVATGVLPSWAGTGTHLIHAYLEHRAEFAAQAAELGVGVAAQPALSGAAVPSIRNRLGEPAAATLGRLEDWLAHGVVVGGGSDAPGPELSPAAGMALAVGEIGAEAAWRLHTTGAAALLGRAGGCLVPGGPGDLVLLADDPLTAPDDRMTEPDFVRGTVASGRFTTIG